MLLLLGSSILGAGALDGAAGAGLAVKFAAGAGADGTGDGTALPEPLVMEKKLRAWFIPPAKLAISRAAELVCSTSAAFCCVMLSILEIAPLI